MNTRRQIFLEAGGQVPLRNVERLLRNTNIPVPHDDAHRMDLVVPGLAVAGGVTLFCDATCVSPISTAGFARPGATLRDGAIVQRAEQENRRAQWIGPLTLPWHGSLR